MLGRVFGWRGAGRALHSPGFRWFLWGRVAGAPTGPLRAVVQGWLFYHLTGSALALGWVAMAGAIVTLLFAPLGGVLSDRMEKRWVMIGARVVLTSSSIGIALLFYLGFLQPWHIVVSAILDGIAFAFLDPALTSIVAELVDRETLLNAVSMNAVVEGLTGIVAAVIAGLLIEWMGAGSVYALMALLFAAAIYTHTRLPAGHGASGHSAPWHADLMAGLHYLRASPVLMALVGLTFARLLLSQPANTFLPAFARDDLNLDAVGLGLLNSAMNVGLLISSMTMVSLGDTQHKGRLLLATGIAGSVSAILMMSVRVMPVPFVSIALAVGFLNVGDVVSRTLMQAVCEIRYRGRVLSIVMALFGLTSLAALPAGALADRLSVPWVVSALAALVIVVHMAAAWRGPDLRKLR